MHDTVLRTFQKFSETYLDKRTEIKVLEVGSQIINGGLRDHKTENMTWVGVDIESGPGVDQVIDIGGRFPFDDESFDLVVASSVFEHDIQFWITFLEMVRVLGKNGCILLIAPSQGKFHRFPLDAFRFYPDAGLALEKWSKNNKQDIFLTESFVTRPLNDVWADFVAIFHKQTEVGRANYLGNALEGENWILNGELVVGSYKEFPWEMRQIASLESKILELTYEKSRLEKENFAILGSRVWRYTRRLRLLIHKAKSITAF